MSRRAVSAAAASACWLLLCVRWFDAAAPWRPRALEAVPPFLLLAGLVAALGVAAWDASKREAGDRAGLLLVLALAFAFRLPFVVQGAAGAVTPDGALSGIVALHARDGIERLVFVPHVPYSGSLKSHLTAPLASAIDPARAFALVSVLFYLAFAAGVFRLASRVEGATAWTPRAAGLYAAFAPAFVTRYSVSNDGNYVEVLALGAWACVLAIDWVRSRSDERSRVLVMFVLLGLAGWCHILALVPLLGIALGMLLADVRRALRSAPFAASGLVLGYLPGLLWNAANGWESFRYLLPGGAHVGAIEEGPGLGGRIAGMVSGQWPVLMGYDAGHARALDLALFAGAWLAVAAAVGAIAWVSRLAWREPASALRVLLSMVAVNLAIAAAMLPLVPGNPRYLLFLMIPVPVLLARALDGRMRPVMAGLVVLGALGSLGQLPGTVRADRQWRDFVAALRAEGVGYCFTDFFLATKVNFLSGESVVCSAKLGPTTTEYFFDYRRQVEAAPAAALVAVNGANAEKLERRLERLGVAYERRELMKPVLLRLSRKVDPEELFPDREFPLR
jgi:hypothetical protein